MRAGWFVRSLETVSAFSNEPNRSGGYLLLGVRLEPHALFPTYEIIGVPNPEKVQSDLATQCRSMFNHPVRPEMFVEMAGGKCVVVTFIPEAQLHEKPIYIESRGLPKGAFRRIGATDQKCTEDDLAVFYQSQTHRTYDETIITDADVNDFDAEAIKEYRRARQQANPDAAELKFEDADLLYCLGCAAKHEAGFVPTVAGLLLFGKATSIRRIFPMMRVDYIRVPGREWVPAPDDRFESVDILGPLILIIPRIINTILDDIPKAFHLPANANQRTDVPLIPRTAVREAVVNSVMHRSYRLRQPVQIIRYGNRVEIRNPGHSLVPDDRLGEPGSLTRNEKIAAVLHETRFAETKGSGIRAMREAMSRDNLSPPTFESDREKDNFVVTFLFHHFLNPEDVQWLGQFATLNLSEEEQKALVFVREIGAINNAAYRDINRVETLVASGHLRRLRDLELLTQKGRGAQTYYLPTDHLQKAGNSDESQGLTPEVVAKSQGLARQSQGLNDLLAGLEGIPPQLADAVQKLGGKPNPQAVRDVIRRLCSVKPLRAEQIAAILGRGKDYITRTYLGPMVRERQLEYTTPENPAHPRLGYRTPSREKR